MLRKNGSRDPSQPIDGSSDWVGNTLSIRSGAYRLPIGHLIVSWIVRQVYWIGAISIHHVYLPITITIGLEGNQASIRRPSRRPITGRIIGQVHFAAAIGVDGVDIAVAIHIGAEGDLRTIW